MKLLFSLILSVASATEGEPLLLNVGASRALSIPGITRAAVSDGKIATARAVGDAQLLVTGLAPGRTTLHVWAGNDLPRVFEVAVVGREASRALDVVKVGIEFVEVDGSTGSRYGVKWPELVEASAGATFRGDASGVVGAFSGAVATAKGFLEQLVSEGLARLIAHPLLYVRLGETVTFHSGGEFPVSTSGQQEGRLYPKVDWKPFGISVKVKPESADGVSLSSDVDVEIVETDGSLQVEGVPALTRRKLTTKMESRDGETVILSGLVRRVASEGKEGVPILGGIPILGILFSRSRNSKTESEILLAMTLSFRTRAQHDADLRSARGRLHE